MGNRRILRIPTPPEVPFPLEVVDSALFSEMRSIVIGASRTDTFAQTELSNLVSLSRDDLVQGSYDPDKYTTGYYPGTLTSTVTTNATHSTAGQTFNNVNFDCRVSGAAANVTYNNCLFQGDNSANAIYTASNQNALNIQFNDCTFLPKFPRYETNIVNGHDTKFFRCDMSRGTDIIQISNSTKFTNQGAGWDCGVEFVQCYLHGMGRWTAATGGIVHPSDTVTHNDLIQVFGGSGLVVKFCTLDARWELQYGHLFLKSAGGTVYTQAQAEALPNTGPFISVAIGSLPDGGPFVPPFESNGTGLRDRGEMNLPDLSGILLNTSPAGNYVSNVTFEDNLCIGGQYFTNGGGNAYPGGGVNLGSWVRNRFTRDQGEQGSGVGNGHTIDLGGTWAGHVTAPSTGVDRNYYTTTVSGSDTITVRT